MFNAFNRPPKRTPYRSFDVISPPVGEHTFLSIDLPVAIMPLHWWGRNIPCFRVGCPLCPMVAYPKAFFPCAQAGVSGLKLLVMASTVEIEELAKLWGLGWKIKTKRLVKKARIIEQANSFHCDAGTVSERDIQETLARMFRFPSPEDFNNIEEDWIKASIECIREEMRRPPPSVLPKAK